MIGLERWARQSSISLIRELRIVPVGYNVPNDDVMSNNNMNRLPKPVRRYIERVAENSSFHHHFWQQNNGRFHAARTAFLEENPSLDGDSSQLATFHREYMMRHKVEFGIYHREAWRRAFEMLFEEYRFMTFQVGYWVAGWIGVRPATSPQPTIKSVSN